MADVYDRYHVEWLWLPQHENRKQIAMNFEQYQKVADEHPNDKIYRPQGSRSPLDVDLGDGVTARCFSPPGYIDIDEDLTEEEAKQLAHENCLVLRLSYEGVSATLTGDSNVKCWQRIFGYYKDQPADETGTEVLKTTLLQASHHGSRTFIKENGEDSEAWLDGLETIAPEAVVVSVGEENRHSHPHEDMMDAYRDQVGDDNVYETREHGTIVLEVEAGGQSQIIIDNGRFVEDYGWDDDEDDDEDGGGGDKSAAALRVRRRGASPTRLDNKPAA
jgi:beta-lactamase superfamily II metal-dependent hydrolase